ncbi:MAG: hypothetical protein H6Q04_2698, partial [Acidobacteria bacterium]|nr:hypothetical protein [Acidobacteriota bacterium]
GEIPESTPLFKKLDAFGADLNIPGIPFLKGRISCARTTVELDTKALPIPGISKLFGKMTRSENTGATKYEGGIEIGVQKDVKGGTIGANFGLSSSVSTDGNWNVRDYMVTASTAVTVETGNVTGNIGISGTVTGDSRGNMSGSVTGNAGVSGKFGETTVSVGGEMTVGPNGVEDSDFSAGISQDFANGYGMAGGASFEASTKRGSVLSGAVTDSIMPKDANSSDIDKSPWEKIQGEGIEGHYGEPFREKPPTGQFHKKKVWSGEYKL